LKRKLICSILTLMITMAISQLAMAASRGDESVSPKVTSDQIPLAKMLNLSQDQVKQLKEINENSFKVTKDLRLRLMTAQFELRQLRIEGTDQSAMEAKLSEIKELNAELKALRESKRQKIQSILTPEQQSKLKKLKCQHRDGGCCPGKCQ
jgi:Spy/CpxP family protein refolding chaperone